MFIKESYVHEFKRVECGCGQTDGPELSTHCRWFKVNGVQTCEHCVRRVVSVLED
jgi:hypothetical protein